jgi:hypothetical protein
LNELVRAACDPPARSDPLPNADGSGLGQLRAAAIEIALRAGSTPGGAERLLGCALLCDMWLVESDLYAWDGAGSLSGRAPVRALRALADGKGGNLAPVLARMRRGCGQ